MDAFEIRRTFLDFFEARDHKRYASSPLVPDDPSILLTIAGMVPFKPYFLGDAEPPAPRATSFQKCVRTNDIENVGRTRRHMSFFEMLGNFSFGDYFKREAIRWAWELSVGPLGLDPERLWGTVYEDDDQAAAIWLEETDLPEDRLQFRGADENFWSLGGAGPCGPCSELFYDLGPEWGPDGGPEVDEERFLEYFNLVFMQYRQDADGNVQGELPAKNVDTGMGLERMARIKQGVDSIFDTDVVRPMVDRASELTGVDYDEVNTGGDAGASEQAVSLRVIAEHARTATFLVADGVLPAKEGRGYVLRRVLRRAVRNGRLLDHDGPLMGPMAEQVIETMAEGYPELQRQRELVTRVIGAEEEDFRGRLDQGLDMLDDAIERTDGEVFPGDVAFKLHDTYGFPVDLTDEIARESGLELDRDEFDELMDQQRRRARQAGTGGGTDVPAEVYRRAAAQVGGTEFVGYDALEGDTEVGAIVTPGGLAESAEEGEEVEIVLPTSPFYPEGGGQVGDRGTVTTDTATLQVTDTAPAVQGLVVHRARVADGELRAGQQAHAAVDPEFRTATARSHSATHVLHATIREILGDHAQQAGSLVQPGRLRFDFPHFEQVPDDAVAEIEETINARVLGDPAVSTERMGLEEARASGAMANFEETYGEIVRVVSIGDFSRELCGGTHVHRGATIGPVAIISEESIGANTRRVEALTGLEAFQHTSKERLVAERVAEVLGSRTDEAVERVRGLLERLKKAEKELEQARGAQLSERATQLAADAERDADGRAVVVEAVEVPGMDELRQLAAETRGELAERAVVVLGLATGGKAQMVAAVSDDLVADGVSADGILGPAAEVVGGGGGGSDALAQAGGRHGDKLDEALQVAAETARGALP